MSWTIGKVAASAGITTRTLHHYDEIALLSPSERSASGYRKYDSADIERLQRILFYRELGFPLDGIAALLDDPGTDQLSHLRCQHALITDRLTRLHAMASALEHEMEAFTMGYDLTPEERLEVFGDFNPEDHEEEVHERWGDTDAYTESTRRAKQYNADDWRAIKAQMNASNDAMVAAMNAGEPAESEAAMAAAELHRAAITRWFYECTLEIHTGLGQMFVADPRFTKTYEDIHPGLAQYTSDAFVANAIARS